MNSNVSTVFQPSKSLIVSLRFQFLTGSVDDRNVKEGLAPLTAAMLAQGGSKNFSYDQIVELGKIDSILILKAHLSHNSLSELTRVVLPKTLKALSEQV